MDKKTIAYIVSGAGLAAGIGGIFYAHKKGYGGWGKFGMFVLFSIPFTITAGAIRIARDPEEGLNIPEDKLIGRNQYSEQEVEQRAYETLKSLGIPMPAYNLMTKEERNYWLNQKAELQ